FHIAPLIIILYIIFTTFFNIFLTYLFYKKRDNKLLLLIIPLLFFVILLFLLLYTFCINTLSSYFINKITDIPIIMAPIIINTIVLFVSPVSGNISFSSFSAVSFISLFSPVISTSILFSSSSYPLGAFVSVTL